MRRYRHICECGMPHMREAWMAPDDHCAILAVLDHVQDALRIFTMLTVRHSLMGRVLSIAPSSWAQALAGVKSPSAV